MIDKNKKDYQEAKKQNERKIKLQKELEKTFEEIAKESRNEFLKLVDDYTLELLLDYHSSLKEKHKNYNNAYSLLLDEHKFRAKFGK